MKPSALPLLLATLSACLAEPFPGTRFETGLQARVGFDSNPRGTAGSSATLLGEGGSLTWSAGVNLAAAWAGAAEQAGVKISYAGDAMRFAREPGENFMTHRLGLSARSPAGAWQWSGEGSSLFVDGARDTLASVSSVSANAISLWRERRSQWQHRYKAQVQTEAGAWRWRGTGSLVACDYRTHAVAGKVAFADRTDLLAGLEAGRRQTADARWLFGVQTGHQAQGVIPLPNGNFDYSSEYSRLVTGWEGRPFRGTSLTLVAGPDFRHYSGRIDPLVFTGGRERRSLWFEGGTTTTLPEGLTLTTKATRMVWLSSTGKSAYTDTSVDAAANWKPGPVWSLRLSARLHRCDYFPVVRDDWEALVGAGVTRAVSPRSAVTLDVVSHRAWNEIAAIPEREFHRAVVTLGATLKL